MLTVLVHVHVDVQLAVRLGQLLLQGLQLALRFKPQFLGLKRKGLT